MLYGLQLGKFEPHFARPKAAPFIHDFIPEETWEAFTRDHGLEWEKLPRQIGFAEALNTLMDTAESLLTDKDLISDPH